MRTGRRKYRVEGRRPVGRPRSVEADMAEHEIDKEDVHDRKKGAPNGYSLRVVGVPQSRRTVQIVSTYPASPEARAPSFFGEASHATLQHG